MKRFWLVLLLLLVVAGGVYGLGMRWSPPVENSRFNGPLARLGLSLDTGTDPRTPLLLLASVTSPRAQAAISAREPLGQTIEVGSASDGWWAPMILEQRKGEAWSAVPFKVARPFRPKQLNLGAGESGWVFITIPAKQAGEGAQQFRVRLKVAGAWRKSPPLEIQRVLQANEVQLALQQADIAVRSGEPKKALAMLDALGTRSDTGFARVVRADAYEALGDYEAALEQLEIALSYHSYAVGPPTALTGAIEQLQRKMQKPAHE